MKKLLDYTSLDNYVKVYVPGTMGELNMLQIDQRRIADRIANGMASIFGGCTQTETIGKWVSGPKMITEPVITCQSFVGGPWDDAIEEAISKVIYMCEGLKDEMEQDCISLEVNGKMYFI
jgi:hypothetical protein